MKKKGAKMEVTTFSLPEDIISDILPRLPVKSLSRFKCVSVSWCSITSSKYFIKAQLEHARNAPLADHSILMTYYEGKHVVITQCPLGNLFSQQQIQDVPVCHLSYPKTEWSAYLVGCDNGLCCINFRTESEYIVLFNPTTGLSYKLPPAFKDYEFEKYDYVKNQGFAYDESNDDYKVLLVKWKLGRESHKICRLYSLKENSWKTVDNFMVDAFFPQQPGILLNGKLHWAIDHLTGTGRGFYIATYDLGSETAGSFEQQFSGNLVYEYTSSLGVIQGLLCVLCEETIPTGKNQVWVMKEYGVKESWCKLMTLPCLRRPNNDPSLGIDFSILCMSEGEVLLQRRERLLLCNPITDVVRHLNRDNYEWIRDTAICVQTLVSPFPEGTKSDVPK